MAENDTYYMQDGRKQPSRHKLTEVEAERLRDKGWLVVPVACVKETVRGHLHIFDGRGQYAGARMLDAVQAGDLVRQGCHLVHVADGDQDLEEARVIRALWDENP